MQKSRRSFLVSFLARASVLVALGASPLVLAQEKNTLVPYASIASNPASYAGPERRPEFDLAGPTIRIGLLAPLHGAQKSDGEAIVAAAQLALEDASKRPLPGGIHLALVIGDESGPWGQVSNVVLHFVFDQNAVALVTSANGATSHLSEQIGNKIGVPILALSTDATTTQINLPWIFRMGPSDSLQAQAIVENIYKTCGFRHVLLISERDHDGRVGGREFVEAAQRLGVPPPASLLVDPLRPEASSFLSVIRSQAPRAIVLWTHPENARQVLEAARRAGVHTAVYLSQEAAQRGSGVTFPQANSGRGTDPRGTGIYTVASSKDETSLPDSFEGRYFLATGTVPSPVAAEAYDAVRLIADAVREAGPNRARVRDRISRAQGLAGASGTISFDGQGNNSTNVCLIRLQ